MEAKEDFFSMSFESEAEGRPEFTKDEFISRTKNLFDTILEKYYECWEDDPAIDNDSENSEPCGRCGGSLYIEQGGDIVDCDSCNGTGIQSERVFNSEEFLGFMEHEVMFGSSDFLDLYEAKIKNPKQNN